METNETPYFDSSINTTGCCAKFNPTGWDDQTLHFDGKRFVRASTVSVAHIPLNMGSVFSRVMGHIAEAGADDISKSLVLSRDKSAFAGEHLFAVEKDVPGEEMTTLSGNFLTKTFDGPYSEAASWHDQMRTFARSRGARPGEVWFYYTTCPKCAKAYGQNPVVGVVELVE